MPWDPRPRQGSNRSRFKSCAYRGARTKITAADTGYRDDTLSLNKYQGLPNSDQGNNMADGPRFGFWTSVSQCLQYLWTQRHLGLLLLLFWTLVVLFCLVNTVKLPLLAEAAELEPQLGSMLRFFFPTKPTQMFRVFGLAAISIIVLGFLPMCCCSFCRRRKRMNRMLKILKKQKSKGKRPKGRKASEERALLFH
ncbi:fragile X mental retardation 1 neighbor protein isoform X2 [Mus pahari]|uniref:fragile X mental retardation 1 neighbor protein isoform X2 n=1 Tax=Mus pahari TaxID=10093 RepID=UPI000A3110FD|nr:fragile X mental retardation 1 neighbor protein isoform X2 [Mus pahari]